MFDSPFYTTLSYQIQQRFYAMCRPHSIQQQQLAIDLVIGVVWNLRPTHLTFLRLT